MFLPRLWRRRRHPLTELGGPVTGLDYEPGDFIVHFYHTKDAALRLKGMARYYEEWLCSQAEHQLATDEVDSFSGGYKWVARKPSDDFR